MIRACENIWPMICVRAVRRGPYPWRVCSEHWALDVCAHICQGTVKWRIDQSKCGWSACCVLDCFATRLHTHTLTQQSLMRLPKHRNILRSIYRRKPIAHIGTQYGHCCGARHFSLINRMVSPAASRLSLQFENVMKFNISSSVCRPSSVSGRACKCPTVLFIRWLCVSVCAFLWIYFA